MQGSTAGSEQAKLIFAVGNAPSGWTRLTTNNDNTYDVFVNAPKDWDGGYWLNAATLTSVDQYNGKTINNLLSIYDNLNLKNVAGTLIIRDQAINLKGLTMAVFGGKIGVNGMVSTKNKENHQNGAALSIKMYAPGREPRVQMFDYSANCRAISIISLALGTSFANSA